MFRFVTVFSLLFGFLIAQTSHSFGAIVHVFIPIKEYISSSTAGHQSADDADSPVTEEKEESDEQDHSCDLKGLISQDKFQFTVSHRKALWVDSHFTPWLLAFDFERPPRGVS